MGPNQYPMGELVPAAALLAPSVHHVAQRHPQQRAAARLDALDAHVEQPLFAAASPPRLRYTSLLGDVLEVTHWPLGEQTGDEHKINGRVVDYRAFPLMGNPWVHQEAGAPRLTLRDEEETVVYDFDAWDRTGGDTTATPTFVYD